MGFKEAIEAANAQMQRGERQTDRYAGLLAQKRQIEQQNRNMAMQNMQMFDAQIDDLDWLRNTSDEDKGRFMYTRNQYAAQVGAPEWQQVPDRRDGDWAGDVFNLQASIRQAPNAKEGEKAYLSGKQQLIQKYGLNWWAKNFVNLQNMATQSGSFDLQPQGAGVTPEQKPQAPQAEQMPKSATDEQAVSGEGQLTPSATPSTDIPQKPITSYSIDEMFDAIFRPYIPTEKTRQEEIEGWNKLYSVIKPTAGGVKPPQGLQVEYWQRGVKLGFVQPVGEVKWENGEPIPSQADLEALDTEFSPEMTDYQRATLDERHYQFVTKQAGSAYDDAAKAIKEQYAYNKTDADLLPQRQEAWKLYLQSQGATDQDIAERPMPASFLSYGNLTEEDRQNINLKRDELKWKQEYQKHMLDLNWWKARNQNSRAEERNIIARQKAGYNVSTSTYALKRKLLSDINIANDVLATGGFTNEKGEFIPLKDNQLDAYRKQAADSQALLDELDAKIAGGQGGAVPDGSVDTGGGRGQPLKLKTQFTSGTQHALVITLREYRDAGQMPTKKAWVNSIKHGGKIKHPKYKDADLEAIWDFIDTEKRWQSK